MINNLINKKPILFYVTQTPKGLDGLLSISPDVIKKSYCAVVNVSDSPCATFDYQKVGIPSFWFPINEIAHWGHSPFFGTLRVFDKYYDGRAVFLHCHAGANRSPSIAYAILLSKGYSPEEAEESIGYQNLSKVFQRNIDRKHIPTNIIEFLKKAEEQRFSTISLYGILRNMDDAYEKWSQSKFNEQNDYFIKNDLEENSKLIYNKENKRFILKKE